MKWAMGKWGKERLVVRDTTSIPSSVTMAFVFGENLRLNYIFVKGEILNYFRAFIGELVSGKSFCVILCIFLLFSTFY